MFGKKPSKPQSRIDCLIGAGTVIEGNISFSGGLRVDGKVKGNIVAASESAGTLVLSERAEVDGEIRVSHAVINGTVAGPVHAAEYLNCNRKPVSQAMCIIRRSKCNWGRWFKAGSSMSAPEKPKKWFSSSPPPRIDRDRHGPDNQHLRRKPGV